MEIIKTEIKVYPFEELSETAKEKALQDFALNIYDDWSEFCIDDIKYCAEKLGIEIDNVYFSGFSSQGDGACFTGNYSYKKGALAAIKKEYPNYTELQEIAEALQDIQKRNFYGLSASVSHSGRYYHEMCTSINVSLATPIGERYDIDDDTIDDLSEILRDYMRESYKRLEQEYEYQTSEEVAKECFSNNENLFRENGDIYL